MPIGSGIEIIGSLSEMLMETKEELLEIRVTIQWMVDSIDSTDGNLAIFYIDKMLNDNCKYYRDALTAVLQNIDRKNLMI